MCNPDSRNDLIHLYFPILVLNLIRTLIRSSTRDMSGYYPAMQTRESARARTKLRLRSADHVIERGLTSRESRKCGERILPRFARVRSFIFGRIPGRDGHVNTDPRSSAPLCPRASTPRVDLLRRSLVDNARLLIRAAHQILAPFRESERYRRIAPMLCVRMSRNRESQAHNRRCRLAARSAGRSETARARNLVRGTHVRK